MSNNISIIQTAYVSTWLSPFWYLYKGGWLYYKNKIDKFLNFSAIIISICEYIHILIAWLQIFKISVLYYH